MMMLINILLFFIKLPFRILAIPVVLLLLGIEGVIAIGKMFGSLILGLYNFLILFMLIIIIKDKNWVQLWQAGLLVMLEGLVLVVGVFAYELIGVIRELLVRFAVTGKLES